MVVLRMINDNVLFFFLWESALLVIILCINCYAVSKIISALHSVLYRAGLE
jgi:hypothetical protein